MKFLDNLTEALRHIPKDLPGEDEWGEPNIDILLRFNMDIFNKERAEQETLKLIKINYGDKVRNFVGDTSTVFPVIGEPWPTTGNVQMMAYSDHPEYFDPENERTMRQKGIVIRITSMVD